jgi:hypothetical protein
MRILICLLLTASPLVLFANPVLFYHIQPYKHRDGFVAVTSIGNTQPHVVEIDTNGKFMHFPVPKGPKGSDLSTMRLLDDNTAIAKFTDRKDYALSYLCVLDIHSGATRLLKRNAEPVTVSQRGNFVMVSHEDEDRWKSHLYRYEDTLIPVFSVPDVSGPQPVATADNNFFATSTPSDAAGGRYYWITTDALECDTLQLNHYIKLPHATEDSALIYVHSASQDIPSYSPVCKFSFSTNTTTPLMDSMFIMSLLPVPASDVLIFRGATKQEYNAEENDIANKAETYDMQHPGKVAYWGIPKGYWQVYDVTTKLLRHLDPKFDYIATTRSGRHILVQNNDRSVLSVIKTSDLID